MSTGAPAVGCCARLVPVAVGRPARLASKVTAAVGPAERVTAAFLAARR